MVAAFALLFLDELGHRVLEGLFATLVSTMAIAFLVSEDYQSSREQFQQKPLCLGTLTNLINFKNKEAGKCLACNDRGVVCL